MNETELKALLSRIRPADSAAKAAAKERQSKLASLREASEHLRKSPSDLRELQGACAIA